MRISSEGLVEWSPTGIFSTYCESFVTKYPFDTQHCNITIRSWAYTAYEISLGVPKSNAVILDNFQENGEWLLDETAASREEFERDGEHISRLVFSLTLTRRPLFHLMNTLCPIMLFSFLICGVFKLHAESGEKMGYALAVHLAYAVFLIIVSDNIPHTSSSVSILGKS